MSNWRKASAGRYGTHPIYVRVPVTFTQNVTVRHTVAVPANCYVSKATALAVTLPAGGTISFIIRRYDASTPVALSASYNPESGGDLTAGTPKVIPILSTLTEAQRTITPTSLATLEIAAIADNNAITTAGDLHVTLELFALN